MADVSAASYRAVAAWNTRVAKSKLAKFKKEKNHDRRNSLARDVLRHSNNAALCRKQARLAYGV